MNAVDREGLLETVNYALSNTEYSFDQSGLWCETSNGARKLSNFVPFLNAIVTKDNGKSAEKYVEVFGLTTSGDLPEITLPLKVYESMGWITERWGLAPALEVGPNVVGHVKRAAHAIGSEYAQEKTIYTHMGWKCIDGRWCYLYSGGAIGRDNISVELEQGITGYAFPPAAEGYKEAVQASLKMKEVAPLDASIPLLSLVYLCPLNEFFRQAGYEPAFISMLVGPTGGMKSTLAALALSHFGEFTAKSLPGSFKDTGNALEVKGFALKDTLMVVDDFYPAAQRGDFARMTSTMQTLIRAYGDRTGRNRLSSDIKLREVYIPRGNLLVTGEDIPRLEESGMARLFLLELEPGKVDKEVLSSLQDNTGLLNQAMRGFIEWLIPQTDTLKTTLAQRFVEYRHRAQRDNQHQRMAETVAWLQIGYEMFIDYAISSGALPDTERQAALDEAMTVFSELEGKQAEVMKADTPVQMFLTALNELLYTERCSCVDVEEDGSMVSSYVSKGSGFIGYDGPDYYFLIPDITMTVVEDFYNRQGIRFPATKTSLLKQLAYKDLIATSSSAGRVNRTLVKNIGGKNHRYIWLKKNALDGLNTPDE